MAIGKQLSDNNPTGTGLGQSTTDLITFYGGTPIAQPTGATAVTTAAAVVGGYGFSTTAQLNNLVTAVNTIITNLGTSKLNLMG